VLYGQKKNVTTGAMNAIVVHLNFDNEFSGPCLESDLEPWSPRNEHGNCVMGRMTTYYRRAKGKTCYLREDHQRKTEVKNCECQTEDYECDHCFFRPDLSSPCQLQCLVPNLPPDPPLCVNSTTQNQLYYTLEKTGYRIVDNDTCDPTRPNAETPKSKIPCKFSTYVPPSPNIKPPSTQTINPWIVLFIIVLSLIVLAVALWLLWKYNSSFHNCISHTFGIEDGRETKYETVPVEDEQGQSLAENIDPDDSLEDA